MHSFQKDTTLLAALPTKPLASVPFSITDEEGPVDAERNLNHGQRSALGEVSGLLVIISVSALNIKFLLGPALILLFADFAAFFTLSR